MDSLDFEGDHRTLADGYDRSWRMELSLVSFSRTVYLISSACISSTVEELTELFFSSLQPRESRPSSSPSVFSSPLLPSSEPQTPNLIPVSTLPFQARSITRLCSDAPEHRTISGKLLAILHSTLSGTQYIFQGQELAQINVPRSWGEEEYKDIATRNYWNSYVFSSLSFSSLFSSFPSN